MASGKYREEELIDGLVVDKEGYICGYVSAFGVEPDHITINLYEYDIQRVETLDEEELVKRILDFTPKKTGFFLRKPGIGKSGIADVYDRVRKRLSLAETDSLTLEHMVEYAKAENIDIPYGMQEIKEKVDKGSIDWSSIDKIAFTELGKCLLLTEVVAATNKAASQSKEIGYKSSKDLAGRIVLDSEAKIVGTAVTFLVGNPPGILVNIERAMRIERPDPEALKSELIPNSFTDLKQLYDQVKKDQNVRNVTNDDLINWARKYNLNVPTKVEERRETTRELPLNWNTIAKIGDVIILKKDIAVLIEEDNKANTRNLNRVTPPSKR